MHVSFFDGLTDDETIDLESDLVDALTENPALALGRDKLDPSDPLYGLFVSILAYLKAYPIFVKGFISS